MIMATASTINPKILTRAMVQTINLEKHKKATERRKTIEQFIMGFIAAYTAFMLGVMIGVQL